MGICLRDELIEDVRTRELSISTRYLKRYLSSIGHILAYRTTILPREMRHDKNGQPSGVVITSDVTDILHRIQWVTR